MSLPGKKNQGYMLLGIVFVLAILAMTLSSSLDTTHAEIVREKEAEFKFRGEQIAKAIARYNNGGILTLIHPGIFPSKIGDLAKETNINGRKLVFLRKFAMIDPITGGNWRPVRAGDPLINEYLQNWAAYYMQPIPPDYQFLAGGGAIKGVDGDGSDGDSEEEEEKNNDNKPNGGGGVLNNNNNSNNSNGGSSGSGFDQSKPFSDVSDDQRPIIGVVSRSKEAAYRRLLGKDVKYNQWLFIYLPDPKLQQQQNNFTPGTNTR